MSLNLEPAIESILHQYNKKIDFSKGKKFLEPISLYRTFPPENYEKDNSPIKDQRPYFEALHFLKYKITNAQNKNYQYYWALLFSRLRNRLISMNIGLIYMCIRNSSQIKLDIDDKIEAGQLALIRSVELYDPWKFKTQFSTYACNAIINRFIHILKEKVKHSGQELFDHQAIISKDDSVKSFLIERIQIAMDKAHLTDKERYIIQQRFFNKSSLKDISKVYNKTIERIRQIQYNAIIKIGQVLRRDDAMKDMSSIQSIKKKGSIKNTSIS